jgi:hypothetical protein
MSRASPIIFATNAGELSPTLDGRVDLAKYTQGCKRLENFLTLIQGPAVRRGGFRFVQAVKDQAKRAWLVKFEFNVSQAYILEFGDLYVRFYTNHGVLLSGGVPYEIVSPYALADLTNSDGTCALTVVQSGDVLYIANAKRTYEPRTLTRLGATNWVFATYAPSQGPFLEMNASATTLQASAATGAMTLTAGAALFASTDVGRLVRIESQNLTVRPWETAKGYVAGNLVRFDGKTYIALNNATSGSSPPVHEQGSAYDGLTGVQWSYQHSGYGIARITGFTNSTSVSATVLQDSLNGLNVLPDDVVSGSTLRWQLGAWSGTTEYPGAVAFFRNRLFWFGKQRLWASVPDDFTNMSADFFGEVRADNSIVRILAAEDVNDIQWAVGGDRLVIGTGGGEFVAGEITTTDPLGPANFEIVRQSRRRVRRPVPAIIGTSICYVQRAGRKLLSLNYDYASDRFASTDLAVLAERITRTGIVDMAYQGEPYSILWCVLSNGKLLSFTYDQEQQVQGWARHPIGGADAFVEAVNVIPSPDGSREEVWIVVRRTINGALTRYVEFLERPWEGADVDGTAGDNQVDAFYVDAGLTYTGAPAATVTGLSHLEGETVQVFADGARQPDRVVAGGTITLSRTASVVQVGLQYVSRLVPMRLEAGSSDGTSQGKTKRVNEVVARFFETLGGKCGRYGKDLDDLSLRSPFTPMGQGEAFTSGDKVIDFPSDYDRDALIEIVQDAPLPMTVIAIMPTVRTYPQ